MARILVPAVVRCQARTRDAIRLTTKRSVRQGARHRAGVGTLFGCISGRFDAPVDPAQGGFKMTDGTRVMRAGWRGALAVVGVLWLLGSAAAVHAQTADLSVTVTDAPDPANVFASPAITYTVTVTNNGPGAAANVVLLQALPPNNTSGTVTVTPAGWTCTNLNPGATTPGFECTIASLPASTSAVFTFTVTLSFGIQTGAVLTDNVTVTSTTVDPDPSNNLAATTTTINNPEGSESSVPEVSVTKTGPAGPVEPNQNVAYTITFTNNSATDASGADTRLVEFTPPDTTFVSLASPATWTCSTPAVGGIGTINCTNATGVAAGGTGAFTLTVKVIAGTPSGVTITNLAKTLTKASNGFVDTNAANNQTTFSVSTQVTPPTIAKAFGVHTLVLNGTTTMTITLANPNAFATLTGIAFSDPLPSGLVVATPNGLSNPCGGAASATAGASSVSLTGVTLAAGASCSFKVNVTATSTGAKSNTTSTVTSNETVPGGTASDSLNAVAPPTISKAFSAPSVPLNGIPTLTFTLTNPNAGTPLTGVGFTDPLPSGLVIATPNGLINSCTGTITATPGSPSVSLAGATLAAGGSCAFTVNLRTIAAGSQDNTTGVVTSTEGGPGNTASASLLIVAPPTIAKAFGATTIQANGTTTLSFTLTNPNPGAALSGVRFTDTLPDGLVVASPNGLTGSCSGPITAPAGGTSVNLEASALAPNGSCTFSVNVIATSAGTKNNTTTGVTSIQGGPGGTASATLVVTASSIPTLSSWVFALLAMVLAALALRALRARGTS
jgi:uncharacterized repeat protein (TIGR01451 family)